MCGGMPSIPCSYGWNKGKHPVNIATLVEVDNDTMSWEISDIDVSRVEGIEYLTYEELQTQILPLLVPAPTIITRIYSPMKDTWSLQRVLPVPFHKYTITHDGIICPVHANIDTYNPPALGFTYRKNKGRSNWGRHKGDVYEIVHLRSTSGHMYPLVVQDLIAHTFLPNPNKCRRSEYTESAISDSTFRNVGYHSMLHLQNLQWEE